LESQKCSVAHIFFRYRKVSKVNHNIFSKQHIAQYRPILEYNALDKTYNWG